MRRIILKKKQKNLFKILLDFKTFAEKHKIKYFLSGGSLLGAVKYGGFIPWDDDIDIYILREDFLKLKEIIIKSNIKYTLCKIYFNDRFVLKKSKKFTNFLDISILDKSPKTKLGGAILIFLQKILRCSLYKKIILNQKTFIRKLVFLIYYSIGKILINMIGKENIYNIQDMVSRLGKSNINYTLFCSDTRYLNVEFNKKWFDNPKKIKFNKVTFPTIGNIIAYLKQQYGDIKKDPILSQQKPNHLNLSFYIYDFYKTLKKK